MGRNRDVIRPDGQSHAKETYVALEEEIERLTAALFALLESAMRDV
jgi:hypothetical protein